MTIQRTTLDNGLTILTDSMEVASFTLGIWVDIGSRNEWESVNGITHFLEHMIFKGTARRSALAITQEIENVGGRLNAYTTKEYTTYYIQALAEYLPLTIDLLGDMLQNSVFDPQELEREKNVILQEIWQSYDAPEDIIFDHFQQTAYPSCPLGKPIIGNIDNVKRFDREALFEYFYAYYKPRAMILAAAGKVDHAQVVESAARAFPKADPVSPKYALPSLYCGGEYRVTEKDLQQTHVVVGFKGLGFDDDALYSSMVLNVLFGGGMSSRLFQEIRERRGLAYSIYSFLEAYQEEGLFGIYGGTSATDLQEMVSVACDQLCQTLETLTEDEVNRATVQLKSSLLMDFERSSARCRRLALNMLHFKRIIPVAEIVSNLEAVTPATVKAVLHRHLLSPPTLALLGPDLRLESYQDVLSRLP